MQGGGDARNAGSWNWGELWGEFGGLRMGEERREETDANLSDWECSQIGMLGDASCAVDVACTKRSQHNF